MPNEAQLIVGSEAVENHDMSAQRLGRAICEWARRNGALAQIDAVPSDENLSLEEIFQTDADAARRIRQVFNRVKITSVAVDNENRKLSILCKGVVSSAADKKLPKLVHGIAISYASKVVIESNPAHLPHSAAAGAPIWFSHSGLISCGSSVTASHIFDAGTLGFLATLQDGTIVGFSNNHVTGDSNHTPAGMHILSPSPFDSSPASPPPVAIGKHLSLAQLFSGDPQQVSLQELDAAIFQITEPGMVTSMQGNGAYDTPSEFMAPSGGLRVKKVGRTTGLRAGTLLGSAALPMPIPYSSAKFKSTVYFTDVWAVQGDGGNTFSEPGDSGSLVVSLDGTRAVGVVFAGGSSISYMIPIEKILNYFNITLLSGHNLEGSHEQSVDGASSTQTAEVEP